MTPDLSIIVVSYNTRDMTLACLRSVFEQTRSPFELIVIDNESPDGSADAIEREFAARLTLIRSGGNLGFARANNVAAERAAGEYLLLLNPDTVVLDGAIDRLLAFARANQEAGVWGGRTRFADGSLNPSSCWRRMTLWNLFCRASGLATAFPRSAVLNTEAFGGWPRDTVRRVDIVSGCFLLIRRSLWSALGGFAPEFFMYGEEADLCLRARAHGADPMVTPEATIIHHGGASEKVRADKLVRLLRAKRLLILRHFGAVKRPLALILFDAWPLTRSLAGSLAGPLLPAGRRESARAWAEVWSRRREWRARPTLT